MARIRLGKSERLLRKTQWKQFRELKKDVITRNLGAPHSEFPTSKGYRMSPDMKMGYQFHDPSNLPRHDRFNSDGHSAGFAKPLPAGTGSYRK